MMDMMYIGINKEQNYQTIVFIQKSNANFRFIYINKLYL